MDNYDAARFPASGNGVTCAQSHAPLTLGDPAARPISSSFLLLLESFIFLSSHTSASLSLSQIKATSLWHRRIRCRSLKPFGSCFCLKAALISPSHHAASLSLSHIMATSLWRRRTRFWSQSYSQWVMCDTIIHSNFRSQDGKTEITLKRILLK